jgi:hypothetical protein
LQRLGGSGGAAQVRSQRVLYRISDPYLRFWFRYVAPFQSLIQLGKAEQVWQQEIAPSLDEFVARTSWQEVCLAHLWGLRAADRLPADVAQLGRWWDGHDEIDLVGLWKGYATVVGECKWRASPVGIDALAAGPRRARKCVSSGPSARSSRSLGC